MAHPDKKMFNILVYLSPFKTSPRLAVLSALLLAGVGQDIPHPGLDKAQKQGKQTNDIDSED